MQDLKKLTFEMDCALGSVNLTVESLSELEIVLDQLRDSMDGAVHRGEEKLYYREHHRSIRLMHDLMHYLMKDLVESSEKAYELHLSMFEAIREEAQ